MEISAVSRSRISPTMMMSGSWRKNDFSATANVSPAFSLTLTWLTPGRLISEGSSAVAIFTPGLFNRFRQVYKDTVLPEPVGPVTRIMPYGRPIACNSRSFSSGSYPKASMPSFALLGSRIRITIFSPNKVGSVLTRKSITRSGPTLSFIRPS